MEVDYKPMYKTLKYTMTTYSWMLYLSKVCGDELEKRGYRMGFQTYRMRPTCQIGCHNQDKTMQEFEEDVQVIIDALPGNHQPDSIKPTVIYGDPHCFEANWEPESIEMRAYRMVGCKITFEEVTKKEAKIDCHFDKV